MSVHDDQQTARLAAEARARNLPEWAVEAARAVPTDLVQDLVGDARRGISQNLSMTIADRQRSSENETHRTRAAEIPLTSPPGVALMDRMLDEQDFLDRAARLKERIEAVLIARQAQSSKG